jgi:hypothetical protein
MNKYKEAVINCQEIIDEVRENPNASPPELYDWAIKLSANKVLIGGLAVNLWQEAKKAEEKAKNEEYNIYENAREDGDSIKDAEIDAKQLTKSLRKEAIELQTKSRKYNLFIQNINDVISTIQTKVSYLKSERVESSLPESSSN